MHLAEALAREAIRKTLGLYNFAVDCADFDALTNVFHPDASLSMQGSEAIQGVDAIIAKLKGGSRSGGAFRDGKFQRHHLTSESIDVVDADTATGEHYVLVITELGVDHSGRYVDRYVRDGEHWLISQRAATMEWAQPDSRFVRWIGSAKVLK
jgi:SnoaL-like domain